MISAQHYDVPCLCPIFFFGRVGSTLMIRLMNSHPQIVALGELFNPDGTALHLTGSEYRIIGSTLTNNPDMNQIRLTEPRRFIGWIRQAVKEKLPEKKILAFKISFNQEAAIDSGLLKCGNCKIIILNRRNLLAMHASFEKAKQSGVWHLTNREEEARDGIALKKNNEDEDQKEIRILFDHTQFSNFKRIVEEKYSSAKRTVLDSGYKYCEIDYEDLVSGQAYGVLLDFLELKGNFSMEDIGLVKMSRGALLDEFINQDDVIKYLQDIDRVAWCN